MSRTVATKFMFACIGITVFLVLWAMSGTLSRGRETEDQIIHSVTVGDTVLKVPTPKGMRLQKTPPSPLPEIKIHLVFAQGNPTITGMKMLALTEMESTSQEEFGPEEFEDFKEFMKEVLNISGTEGLQEAANEQLSNQKARLEFEGHRIVEDSANFLTLEVQGKTIMDGKALRMRTLESFGLVNGRILRLVATAFVKPESTPPNIKPQLDEWWQSIIGANSAAPSPSPAQTPGK